MSSLLVPFFVLMMSVVVVSSLPCEEIDADTRRVHRETLGLMLLGLFIYVKGRAGFNVIWNCNRNGGMAWTWIWTWTLDEGRTDLLSY